MKPPDYEDLPVSGKHVANLATWFAVLAVSLTLVAVAWARWGALAGALCAVAQVLGQMHHVAATWVRQTAPSTQETP